MRSKRLTSVDNVAMGSNIIERLVLFDPRCCLAIAGKVAGNKDEDAFVVVGPRRESVVIAAINVHGIDGLRH